MTSLVLQAPMPGRCCLHVSHDTLPGGQVFSRSYLTRSYKRGRLATVCAPLYAADGQRTVLTAVAEADRDIDAGAEGPSQMQAFLLWLTAQGGCLLDFGNVWLAAYPSHQHSCCSESAGVKDMQQQNSKLGVYNAEKGERGMLSLQVCRVAVPQTAIGLDYVSCTHVQLWFQPLSTWSLHHNIQRCLVIWSKCFCSNPTNFCYFLYI